MMCRCANFRMVWSSWPVTYQLWKDGPKRLQSASKRVYRAIWISGKGQWWGKDGTFLLQKRWTSAFPRGSPHSDSPFGSQIPQSIFLLKHNYSSITGEKHFTVCHWFFSSKILFSDKDISDLQINSASVITLMNMILLINQSIHRILFAQYF